jgi:GAF domain-containing protein
LVEELRALGEVSQAVNSTLDLETVLNTIVAKATQLSGTEAGAIYVHDDAKNEFALRATYGMSEAFVAELARQGVGFGESAVAQAAMQRAPVQVADLQEAKSRPVAIVWKKNRLQPGCTARPTDTWR